MKTLTTIFICFFLSYTTAINAKSALTTEILTNQTWVNTNLDGSFTYFEFQDAAILDIIQQKDGESIWDIAFWKLLQYNGMQYLQIKMGRSGPIAQYLIDMDASRLILRGKTDIMVLSHEDMIPDESKIHKTEIIGKWKSPFYNKKTGHLVSKKIDSRQMCKMAFEFKKDGTFQRRIQLGSYVEAEVGIWNLSGDSKFIKLQFTLEGNAEDIYKKELLNIDHYHQGFMKVHTEVKNGYSLNEFELKKS